MSEIVERVAVAIFKRARDESDWSEISEDERHQWRADARAAIAAMREPTETMPMAGFHAAFETSDEPVYVGDHEIRKMWRAMIDDALAD